VGDTEREFPIYIEPGIGAVIKMYIEGIEKPRPLTHDLIGNILTGLNAEVERVVINDLKNNTYYARMFIREENELGKKIVEIDCRPSDSLAISKMKNCPIFVTRKVFDLVGKPESDTF
jgi:bifunctional DNase/RNase